MSSPAQAAAVSPAASAAAICSQISNRARKRIQQATAYGHQVSIPSSVSATSSATTVAKAVLDAPEKVTSAWSSKSDAAASSAAANSIAAISTPASSVAASVASKTLQTEVPNSEKQDDKEAFKVAKIEIEKPALDKERQGKKNEMIDELKKVIRGLGSLLATITANDATLSHLDEKKRKETIQLDQQNKAKADTSKYITKSKDLVESLKKDIAQFDEDKRQLDATWDSNFWMYYYGTGINSRLKEARNELAKIQITKADSKKDADESAEAKDQVEEAKGCVDELAVGSFNIDKTVKEMQETFFQIIDAVQAQLDKAVSVKESLYVQTDLKNDVAQFYNDVESKTEAIRKQKLAIEEQLKGFEGYKDNIHYKAVKAKIDALNHRLDVDIAPKLKEWKQATANSKATATDQSPQLARTLNLLERIVILKEKIKTDNAWLSEAPQANRDLYYANYEAQLKDLSQEIENSAADKEDYLKRLSEKKAEIQNYIATINGFVDQVQKLNSDIKAKLEAREKMWPVASK
jgi:hypothetical protein